MCRKAWEFESPLPHQSTDPADNPMGIASQGIFGFSGLPEHMPSDEPETVHHGHQ